MIKALIGQPLHSITPDRGREFQLHGNVTKALGVEFYFPPPHQLWKRGTNENTNGLLREYFPEGCDLSKLKDKDLQAVVEQLNHRPRKCLLFQQSRFPVPKRNPSSRKNFQVRLNILERSPLENFIIVGRPCGQVCGCAVVARSFKRICICRRLSSCPAFIAALQAVVAKTD